MPAAGGGSVGLGSGALALAFQGQPYPPKTIERLRSLKGTANQELMALAAGLFESSLREQAIEGLDKMLAAEEAEGPNKWEITPPDSHGGMYALGHVAIIAGGTRRLEGHKSGDDRVWNLAQRAAVIVGQELRMGDLIATPDGDCRGWPGMRAPHGAKMDRIYLTRMYREVRGRQGAKLPHRGTGGGLQALKWNPDDEADQLYSLPAVWLRQIIDSPAGPDLLAGPLSPTAPLPSRLRLPVTVYRWPGHTLAVMADPGPDKRGPFDTRGSMAAKRDEERIERCVDWILVRAGKPAKPYVEAGQSWQTPPPTPPPSASRIVVGDGSQPAAPPVKPPIKPPVKPVDPPVIKPPNPPDFEGGEPGADELVTRALRALRTQVDALIEDLERTLQP